MLIAISGRKQSGKDTIGKIIQYLTAKNEAILDINMPDRDYWINISFEDYFKYNMLVHKWKIKKFADKLKDIICLLIGCSRDQLENESFKSKELGEEWWYWYMERDGGYSLIILDYLTTTKKQLKNYEGLELIKPTPRFLLQFIGTNLFRNQLHPEIWVNSLMSEYKNKSTLISEVNYLGDSRCGICKKPTKDVSYFLCDEHIEKSKNNYPNWIITDLRFPNELEAVKKRGGITIRVNRPCDICGGSGYHKMSCPVSKSGEHSSETALDDAEFDYVIDNNGTISELIDKMRNILIENKLIKNN